MKNISERYVQIVFSLNIFFLLRNNSLINFVLINNYNFLFDKKTRRAKRESASLTHSSDYYYINQVVGSPDSKCPLPYAVRYRFRVAVA